jgi:hypothetical protein
MQKSDGGCAWMSLDDLAAKNVLEVNWQRVNGNFTQSIYMNWSCLLSESRDY